jgi:phage-related protein
MVSYTLSGYLKNAQAAGASPEDLQAFYDAQNGQSNRYWEPEKRQGIAWKMSVQEKNRTQLAQELQELLLNGSPEDFDAFLTKHKGVKSILKEQPLKQNEQQSVMLFKLEIDNKGMFQEEHSITIVMPTSQTPTTKKEFSAVSKQVEQDFYLDKAQKAFVEDLEGAGISDHHKAGTKSFVLKPETLKKELEKLSEESVASSRVENMVIEGSHLRGVSDKGGYLLTLEKCEKPQSLTLEQHLTLANELYKENARLVTAASVDSLLKNAKIKGNKAVESSQIDLH